ncbi:lipase family protein [Actinomadura rupiterrae]|uniref:lipase family protein n=1 Tax=Actinomadura rupiterrae TaxID=559627 RepID=UPI0020A40843|nr:lipase family protein [Actinomadura rupiterrae]MCP2339128.1 alpha-beta hydrolase superfamily lysophospholipase [Actinomadura rupiterrae]
MTRPHDDLLRAGTFRTIVASALAVLAALALVVFAPGAFAHEARLPSEARGLPAGTDPGPPGDAFYTPPSPVPAGQPGDVIRARPAKAGPPTARSLADAWQVMYLSKDTHDQLIAETGTILVPKGADPATMPIVAMAPGTSGPAFRCAPSKMIDGGIFYEQAMLNELLKRNWAVAVPDYPGYHANPTTTYITGRDEGHAVLDAVRAAQRLPEAKLSKDAKVLVHGYSQGGGAAMWAGELQPAYAPELNLQGITAGGVPGDIVSVALALDGSKAFGFLFYALLGLHNAYPDVQFDNVLSDAGKQARQQLEGDSCTLELLLNFQSKSVDDYFTNSPLGDSAWLTHAKENRLGSAAIKVPVYQYHSTTDEIVAYPQASRLRDKYCALGVKLTWKPWDGLSHITLVGRGNADALAFLTDRLNGVPASSNCPTTPQGASS